MTGGKKRPTFNTNSYKINKVDSFRKICVLTADWMARGLVVSGVRQMPNGPSGKLTLQITGSLSAITSPAAQEISHNILATSPKERMTLACLEAVVTW